MAAAESLEHAIDPLRKDRPSASGRSDALREVVRGLSATAAAPSSPERLMHFDRAAGVHVDDRPWPSKMASEGQICDGIIGRVQGHRGSRPVRPSGSATESPPGRMRRRRRHDAAGWGSRHRRYRCAACTRSSDGMALGKACCRHLAGPRQVCQHLRKAHRRKPFRPRSAPSVGASDLAWPPRLRRFGLRCLRLRRRGNFIPRLDRHRIPRDVLDKMAIHRPRNRTFHADAGSRKTLALGRAPTLAGDGPRKRRLARKPAGTAPAAQPAYNLKTLDQAARRRNVEHCL